MTTVPVLLYHAINDDPPSWLAPFTVSRPLFAAQLDAVVDSGRIPVSAAQIVSSLDGGPALPAAAVALTFDDGYRDFAEFAVPELARRGLPAALFVTTGALSPGNRSLLPDAAMLTLRQVQELDLADVEIGAHSHLHPQMDTLRASAVERELATPKRILEDALGHSVDLFAYPHGYSNATVRDLARRVGYRGAFAVRNALSSPRDDPFRVARITVRADTSVSEMQAWLRERGAPVAGRRESVRTAAWRFYRRQRERMSGRMSG